jgi:hypothetical protein
VQERADNTIGGVAVVALDPATATVTGPVAAAGAVDFPVRASALDASAVLTSLVPPASKLMTVFAEPLLPSVAVIVAL